MRRTALQATLLAALCSWSPTIRAETEPPSVDVLLRTIDRLSRRVDEIESARASDRQRIESEVDQEISGAVEAALRGIEEAHGD